MEGNERAIKLFEIMSLGWNDIEKKKLNDAFCLIDEVMYECQKRGEKEKAIQIAKAIWELQEIVTSFGVEDIVKGLNKE